MSTYFNKKRANYTAWAEKIDLLHLKAFLWEGFTLKDAVRKVKRGDQPSGQVAQRGAIKEGSDGMLAYTGDMVAESGPYHYQGKRLSLLGLHQASGVPLEALRRMIQSGMSAPKAIDLYFNTTGKAFQPLTVTTDQGPMTAKEAAEATGYSLKTIYEAIKDGRTLYI